MRKKTLGLTVVGVLVVVMAAVGAAAKLGPAGSNSAAAGPAAGSLAREALAHRYSGRESFGIPVPVAREKSARGREASREIMNGFAQQAYSDLAYPHKTVGVAQLQGALAAMRRHDRGDDGGRNRRWEEVGPFTLDVATEATQNAGLPTQWSGRMTAMVVDPTCDMRRCRLYVGAAGGGVWRTDDALDRNPRWKPLDRGLDTTSIGALLIDPHDKSGKTIYVGTGEPSGSGDSEAGLGLYKSTDRGEHWQLVPGSFAVAKDRGIGEIAIDPLNPNHIFIGTTVARHAGSGVSGGRYTPPGAPTIGLYESTNGGQTFNLRFNLPQDPVDPNTPNGNDFFKGGVTDIEYDPADPTTLYFTMFDYGVFRMTGSAAPQNIYAGAGPDPALFGIRYEVAAAKLANGKTRLYVHDGRNEVDANGDGVFEDASRVLRTDDARAATPAFQMLSSNVDGTPGFSSFDVCAAQCSYDMPIAVSPKNPDVVMIGGQTQYGELPPYAGPDRSNGRNIMLSRNAGEHFTDMSGEAKDPDEANHPDVQILAFHPTNPEILFIGSDGGLVRTSGRYVDDSSDCDERNLTGVNLVDCRLWLSHIPDNLITMNAGLRTLQFQDLQPNPSNPLRDAIGGTQDNGTLGYTGRDTWLNFVSGDGGQSGIDAKQGNIRYHTYFAQQGDVNFRGNDPQWWNWIFDPILFSPEASAFYVPFTADPVVGKTAFTGSEGVWRTQNAGGDRNFLENNCNVLGGPRGGAAFTGVDSGCGDWVKLGPGSALSLGVDNPIDKGGPSGGPFASYVVAVERAKTNNGTLWVGTRRGRIWVSKNADSNNPAAVVQEPDCCGTGFNERQTDVEFDRIDTPAQPRRFPSGISVDPRDPSGNTAFISFSGYEAYSPGQPGHVFKAVYNPATGTATWTDLSFNLGDLPITDVELDAPTGDLYASYDWGVLRLPAGGTAWVDASRGLPKVAIYELSQANIRGTSRRVIYAATHGRGGYRLILSGRGSGGGGDDDDDDDD